MNELKLRDLLMQASLFNEINAVKQYPFLLDNTALMDSMLGVQFGGRWLHKPYETISTPDLAEMIIAEFDSKWLGYIQAETLITQLHDEVETIENRTGNNTSTSEKVDLNKVSAYNSDTLLTNDGAESTSTDDASNTEERTTNKVDKKVKQAYELLETYGKRSIMKKVIQDVSSFLTLDIY